MSFPGASFSSLVRHDVYYINGGDLYFLVQTVTFRVHRYFFERESPRFKGLLSAPASPGAQRQGTSDSNAIVLDNVSPEEFAKFLWVFYNPRYSLYHTTPEDWSIILDLAWRWQFGEVKALCVRELERLVMLDVDRISVYHKFDVDRNLLIPRYAALCAREEPISLEEGMKLGLETALMIARIRELSRASPAKDGARSPSASPIQGPEMETMVRQMFDIKGSTESYESGYSPIAENSNSNSSTSFTAAAQAIGAQASPARPVKKTSNEVVNNALNGNAMHDINSPPRAASPAVTAATRARSPPPVAPAPVATAPAAPAPVAPAPTVAPTVPAINTDLSGFDPLTSSGTNAANNAKAEATNATNANAANTTATANGDASTTAPTDGQTSTTEGENKPNAAETPKPEEASAISKTSAANEDDPSNRSASPTSIARGIWNKRGGKAKK